MLVRGGVLWGGRAIVNVHVSYRSVGAAVMRRAALASVTTESNWNGVSMKFSYLYAAVTGSLLVGLGLAACSAGGSAKSSVRGTGAGAGDSGGSSGLNLPPAGGGTSSISVDLDGGLTPSCTQCTDFPTAPILDTGVPANAASQFATAASGAGPCITEPQDGSLFPSNWTRPRVSFSGSGTLHQITFHAAREVNDLVAYTMNNVWTLPADIWATLAKHVLEEDITVTVRSSSGSGAPTESVVKFRVAPVDVGGSIVFWHTTDPTPGATTTALYGFRPGDEGVISALTPVQIQQKMYDSDGQLKQALNGSGVGQARCVGCHTSTPDGNAVAIADHWPWNIALANITGTNVGTVPDYVSQAGAMMAQSPWQGVTTFSIADWNTGRHRYVSSFAPRPNPIPMYQESEFWPGDASNTASGKDNLIWVDLSGAGTVPTDNQTDIGKALLAGQGTLWGIIARTGDTLGAVTPNWSHDGEHIAYTSTNATSDGRIGPGPNSASGTMLSTCNILSVPFNGGAGGQVVKVAAESGVAQYYPDYSPDDTMIAYNRVAKMDGTAMYYRPDAELYVTQADGTGTPRRLVANDPPMCTGLTTATIHNSWPKWAPLVEQGLSASYYFYIFSSSRYSKTTVLDGSTTVPASELFLAAVKIDAKGVVTDYPAIYLWNQASLVATDSTTMMSTVTQAPGLNLTPAWKDFQIPPVPPVVVK
jgi:hypothetical protein